MNHNTWIIIASLTAISATILVKEYTINNDNKYLILASSMYVLLMYSYIKIFKTSDISSMYTLLQIIQILIVVIFGIMFLNESITSNKIIGVGSGLLSVYLLT